MTRLDVSVLLVSVRPETPPRLVLDAARPADALRATDPATPLWIVVDPPTAAAQRIASAPWCLHAEPAVSVAVSAAMQDLLPDLRDAARRVVAVTDPDLGPVDYLLFDSPDDLPPCFPTR